MCSWYETPILIAIDNLILDWFTPKFFLCDLFAYYVLLIRTPNFKNDRHSNSRLIPAYNFLVPPPRVLWSPVTEYETSASYSFSFTRYTSLRITRRTSVSGAPHIGGRPRASPWSVMFFWYEIRNFNMILLCQNFLDYLCIRSTAHRRAMSC